MIMRELGCIDESDTVYEEKRKQADFEVLKTILGEITLSKKDEAWLKKHVDVLSEMRRLFHGDNQLHSILALSGKHRKRMLAYYKKINAS